MTTTTTTTTPFLNLPTTTPKTLIKTLPFLIFSTKPFISLRPKPPTLLRLSSPAFALSPANKKTPVEEEEFEWEGEKKGFGLLDGEGEEDWESEGVASEGEGLVGDGGGDGGDGVFSEPPEEAKLFVGNLPYDVDSEKLAHLFEKAGVVEVAEVIYNRESGQSRGFGFVNMSSVEEAEKAVEMFHRYDCNGRLLSVNKSTPRGSVPERPREFEPSSVRIYVGNLPWQVDDARLEQIFSKHGKVASARIVYDRETGRSRGFGFVTMASKSDHEDAIEALDGQTMDGRAIRVNVAEERPRRGSF